MIRFMSLTDSWIQRPLNSWLPVNGWTKEETFLLQEPQEPENLIYQMHCVLLPLGSSRQLSISGQTP